VENDFVYSSLRLSYAQLFFGSRGDLEKGDGGIKKLLTFSGQKFTCQQYYTSFLDMHRRGSIATFKTGPYAPCYPSENFLTPVGIATSSD